MYVRQRICHTHEDLWDIKVPRLRYLVCARQCFPACWVTRVKSRLPVSSFTYLKLLRTKESRMQITVMAICAKDAGALENLLSI